MQTTMRALAATLSTVLLIAAAPAPTSTNDSVPLEQDDAGSGRDAGATFTTAVPIERGVQYSATLLPAGDGFLPTEEYDWFTFRAEAGESITAAILSEGPAPYSPLCLWIVDENGEELTEIACGDETSFTAPSDGTYALQVGYFAVVPTTYEFVVDPDVTLFDPAAMEMRPDPDQPTVVVAVADTGVNPYHEAYRRPHLTVHPCTWVAGFDDCSIPALDLSIGEYDSYAEAYAADRLVWQTVEIGQWYWIPGTNIIGAVCDGSTNVSGTPPPVSADAPCIHDEHGHGTGTTSSVLSEAPNALLLVHEGNSGASALEYAPVVPDIQSHSWGPAAPLPLHAADPVLQELFGVGFADHGSFDEETLFFIAAGNEAPWPTLIDASRVHPAVQVVGGGFPGKATTSSWSTFDYASWFCRPTAVPDSIDEVRPSYCGTSFSAPTAAGTAAAALLELRQREGWTGRTVDGMVTPTISRDAFVAALRAGATYDAEQRFDNQGSTLGGEVPLPEDGEHYFWGYGWLDASRVDAIVACAAEGACPAKSASAETWNETRQEARRRQTQSPL